ncbi:indole-3-glycerol phosphate synthase TrpC [bacterium]|nr:indole-3-glycerol phosphate synthase TrpC [bacterium]
MPEQSFLSRIAAHKQAEVRAAQQRTPLAALAAAAQAQAAPRDFMRALTTGPNLALIAELKKASPSAGVLRADFDVTQLARSYAAHGAAALSVLTDATYFQGHLAYLEQAAAATGLPILRKDFLIDSYQIVEARAFGADAVLLIAALLSAERLHELLAAAEQWGLAALVEVHEECEIESALAAGAKIIGINNRDLHTFAVNLATAERLVADVPAACVRVAESGISSRHEVERLAAAGFDAILIGSHLMRQADPGRGLTAFTGVPRR